MDKLAEKTEKDKFLSVNLLYTNKRLHNLESKKTMFTSCVSEINQYMHRLMESCESMLTVFVRQHLSGKTQTRLCNDKSVRRCFG